MNRRQKMRWLPVGARHFLQLRAVVFNDLPDLARPLNQRQ
jgi:hypothetical protein